MGGNTSLNDIRENTHGTKVWFCVGVLLPFMADISHSYLLFVEIARNPKNLRLL